MKYWQIERSSDGFVAVVEAENREHAEALFEARYGFGGSDGQVDESNANEYAEFQQAAADGGTWHS